jgi:hypothetical protein
MPHACVAASLRPAEDMMRLWIATSALLLAAAAGSAAQNEKFTGTWELNLAKSTGPQPKSETLRIHVANNEEHYIVEALNENGSRLHTEYRAKYDGKDYPNRNLVTETTTFVSIQALDANTELVTNKRDGKVTSSYRRVLSADGQTLTSTILGPDGAVRSVRVFDRK